MPRFLAVLEYDGTDFHGSQLQAEGRSVQGELERSLAALAGGKVDCILAGRTDSGVHAGGQVVAFDLARAIGGIEVVRALNGLLPRDASVREAAVAPPDFNPRYWARARRYRYTILDRPTRSALLDRFSYHVAEPLDAGAMRQAAGGLLGRHDFGAFGRPPQGDNTWRTIGRLDVGREGELLTVIVEADAFLRRMVRLIVGVLIDAGRGKLRPDSVGDLLAGDGRPGSPAAPAKGLSLEAVAYERERLGCGTGLWWSCEPLSTAV